MEKDGVVIKITNDDWMIECHEGNHMKLYELYTMPSQFFVRGFDTIIEVFEHIKQE
jgi:hypothetical protein